VALQKQSVNISFGMGLDTKTDKWQLSLGNFLSLTNSVFTTGKQLTKRNGFPQLTLLPAGANASTITTFKTNLTAIGSQIYAYSAPSAQWEPRGYFRPLALSVLSLVRTPYSQTVVDSVTAPNGLVLVAFLDGDGFYKYQISDSNTSQVLVNVTQLPSTATLPRTFLVGNYFIITFLATVSAATHIRYIAISLNNITNPYSAADISTQVSSLTAGYDGYVENTYLYTAWDANDGGGAIRAATLSSTLAVSASHVVISGHTATQMSVTTDNTQSTPVVWITAYASNNAYTTAVNQALTTILAAKHTISSEPVNALSSTAQNMTLSLFWEVENTSFGTVLDYINLNTLTQSGTLGTESTIVRGVGLASKAFLVNGVSYMLTAYGASGNTFQPSYFMIDGSGNVIGKLAYANGSGYVTTQILPSVSIIGTVANISYLYRDLIQALNKTQGSSMSGVYAQIGVNLAKWDFATNYNLSNVEIGNNLHIAGGFVWMYDGVKPVEHNFHVWPEEISQIWSATGGSMAAKPDGATNIDAYFYVWTYEWTDNQGNIHRSAPSIPTPITTTGSASTGSVSFEVPTLKLTYKTSPNAVRLVGYRWSVAQQTYYQITSVTAPLLNNPAVDYVSYVDTQPDSAILGNNILYTTGGVVENIAFPATQAMALYKSRLILLDSEDPNLWWFSKQVVEATPVEPSDLFTEFLAPTSGAQGSTGNLTAAFPMDDKIVFFKKDASYYVIGTGPDNTGANNDFSDPIFIASTVGVPEQDSIALVPSGLMFQSDKGIWLLGRDMSTSYIGAPVEGFNGQVVTSALAIPNTNQVRFTVSGTQSSTLYQGMHTILDDNGVVCQETPGMYMDNTQSQMLMYDYYYQQWGEFALTNSPVLMSFSTSWMNLAGLQGYERFYYFYLLGQFISPHKLQLGIAYDYNPSIYQAPLIAPDNYEGPYGDAPIYGDQFSPMNIEWWRIFANKQKVTSFQIVLQEVFDPSLGTAPGAGLTISGLNLVVGLKKGYRTRSAALSTG
jgi:hypothetical protein